MLLYARLSGTLHTPKYLPLKKKKDDDTRRYWLINIDTATGKLPQQTNIYL